MIQASLIRLLLLVIRHIWVRDWQSNAVARTLVHVNVSEIELLKLVLIYIILIKLHVFVISITSRWIYKAKFVISHLSGDALISLRALSTVSEVFDAGASIEESEIVQTLLTLVATQLWKPVVFELTAFETCLLMMMNWYVNPFLLETFHVTFRAGDTRVFANIWRLLDVIELRGKLQVLIHLLLLFQFLILFMNLSQKLFKLLLLFLIWYLLLLLRLTLGNSIVQRLRSLLRRSLLYLL